jgi:serine protease Do
MKQIFKKASLAVLALGLLAPASSLAQKDKDDKVKKEGEQITITRTGDTDGKVVIELDGDNVSVNGKRVTGADGDVKVHRSKIKDVWAFGGGDGLAGSWGDNFGLLSVDEDRAMLGVTTEKDAKGAEIQTVSKESGAEKAGLKKGDIITNIADQKIEEPDDLSAAVKKYKPGEKVVISYIRDGKELKTTAELGKWKGVRQS